MRGRSKTKATGGEKKGKSTHRFHLSLRSLMGIEWEQRMLFPVQLSEQPTTPCLILSVLQERVFTAEIKRLRENEGC